MKKLLLLSALLIFTCSSDLFAQDYMKMRKKELRIAHQKKLKLIDSLSQELSLSNKKSHNLQSDLNNSRNDLTLKSESLNNSNLEITQLEVKLLVNKNDLSQLGLEIDNLNKQNSDNLILINKLKDSISNQKLLAKQHTTEEQTASINFNYVKTINYDDTKFLLNDSVELSEKVISRTKDEKIGEFLVKGHNFYFALVPEVLFYHNNDNNLINDAIIRYDNSPEGNFLIYISKGSPYKYVWFYEENNSFKIRQSMEKISKNKWFQKEYYGKSGPVIEGSEGKLYEYEEYLVRKGDFIKSGLEIHYYPSEEIKEIESGLLLQSGNINQRDNTNGLFSERYFYENGQLAEIEIYIDNKKIVRYWDENGKPIAILFTS